MSDFECNVCGAVAGATCQKTGEPAVAMVPPIANLYWNEVQAKVCATRWAEWKEMEIKIINEYRLNMLEREHRKMLKKFMNEFLGFDDGTTGAAVPDAVAQNWKPADE